MKVKATFHWNFNICLVFTWVQWWALLPSHQKKGCGFDSWAWSFSVWTLHVPPVPEWVLFSGFSGFLPLSKYIHLRRIVNSKLAAWFSLYVTLRSTGTLSRVQPHICSTTAVIGPPWICCDRKYNGWKSNYDVVKYTLVNYWSVQTPKQRSQTTLDVDIVQKATFHPSAPVSHRTESLAESIWTIYPISRLSFCTGRPLIHKY